MPNSQNIVGNNYWCYHVLSYALKAPQIKRREELKSLQPHNLLGCEA